MAMQKAGFHYAWVICGCSMLVMFCNMGLVSNQNAVLLPYIIEENSFSNTAVSFLPTIRGIASFLSMLVTDHWYHRLGMRLGLTIATASAALSMALYALAHSLWAYYAAAALSGFGYGVGTMIPVTLLLDKWFSRRLGFCLGLAAVGSSIAGATFPPLLALVIARSSLARAYWLQAGILLAAAVLLWLLLRDKPQQMGLLPWGGLPQPAAAPAAVIAEAEPAASGEPRLSISMGRRDQMLMLFALGLCGVLGVSSPSYLAVHFGLSGYAPMLIATAFSFLYVVEAGAKVLCGAVMDRMGAFRANALFFSLLAIGYLFLARLGGSAFWLFFTLALCGVGIPIAIVGIPVWAGDVTDRAALPHTVKRYQAACSAGSMLGSPLIGLMADWQGNYALVYLLSALLCLVCLGLVQRTYRRYAKAKVPARLFSR